MANQRQTQRCWPVWAWIVLLALGAGGCAPSQLQDSTPPSLPQDLLIQVYFNHGEGTYTDPYRQQPHPGTDLEAQIVEAIAGAQSSVELAVQEFRLPRIAQALRDRQRAGVKVRVIIENTYRQAWSGLPAAEVAALSDRERDRYEEGLRLIDENGDGTLSPAEIRDRDAIALLEQARIPLIDDREDGTAGSGLMHHKFVVVDGRHVIVTSANFTLSDVHGDLRSPDTQGNANNLLKIDSPELAALFQEEFNQMWGDGPGGQRDSRFGLKKTLRSPETVVLGESVVRVQFSPTSPTLPFGQSTNGLIGRTLNSAAESVNLALFVFSEQALANILEQRHDRGAQVRALIDPSFAFRDYSEGLDLLGVALAPKNCDYEADNRPWRNPVATVGTPTLPRGDLLHHKFAVVDQRIVITGSHNWSPAGNHTNDETLLVVQNPIVAAHFEREFERLYETARLGLTPQVQERIDEQARRCSAQA